MSGFSDRELICLRCLARGEGLDSIAAALLIGVRSAEILRESLQVKLGFATNEELREYSRGLGLS